MRKETILQYTLTKGRGKEEESKEEPGVQPRVWNVSQRKRFKAKWSNAIESSRYGWEVYNDFDKEVVLHQHQHLF